MNPIPQNIQEPVAIFPEEKIRLVCDDPGIQEPPFPEPSIPYGYEDTKEWSWR